MFNLNWSFVHTYSDDKNEIGMVMKNVYDCIKTKYFIILFATTCICSELMAQEENSRLTEISLTTICVITENVPNLVNFYTRVLDFEPQKNSSTYAEFRTERGILAMFEIDRHNQLVPNSVELIKRGNTIVEFQVQDVDEEYERLKAQNIEWVKEPTIQPWGTRSIYFRDPDGNMIHFYTTLKQ